MLSPNLGKTRSDTNQREEEDPFRHSPSHLVEARAHRGAPVRAWLAEGLDSRGLELSGAVLLATTSGSAKWSAVILLWEV